MKVSPDIEVEERLGIPSRELSQAYLKINHEVPPGKTVKVLEWLPQSPDLNIFENLKPAPAVHVRRLKRCSARKNGGKLQKQELKDS